jgi:hypothetical protein
MDLFAQYYIDEYPYSDKNVAMYCININKITLEKFIDCEKIMLAYAVRNKWKLFKIYDKQIMMMVCKN